MYVIRNKKTVSVQDKNDKPDRRTVFFIGILKIKTLFLKYKNAHEINI